MDKRTQLAALALTMYSACEPEHLHLFGDPELFGFDTHEQVMAFYLENAELIDDLTERLVDLIAEHGVPEEVS